MAYRNIITLGEITTNSVGQPRVEICLEAEENGEKRVVGYLTPFRDYRFQISMTPDGEGDLGSTHVTTNLAVNIRRMREDIARSFVWGQIMWAVQEYSHTSYARKDGGDENMIFFPRMNDRKAVDEYVTAVLRWAGIEAENYWA